MAERNIEIEFDTVHFQAGVDHQTPNIISTSTPDVISCWALPCIS